MRRPRPWILALLAAVAWPGGSSVADAPDAFPNGPAAFAPRVVVPLDDRALAAAIDRALEEGWAKQGVTPAPQADDAEFLRRGTLGVAGRIPPVSEARAFLASADAEKRRELVERLLASQAYATHMTNTWLELLLPEARSTVQVAFFARDFEVWLRKQFRGGVGYDAMV